jgi:hypothetical protein
MIHGEVTTIPYPDSRDLAFGLLQFQPVGDTLRLIKHEERALQDATRHRVLLLILVKGLFVSSLALLGGLLVLMVATLQSGLQSQLVVQVLLAQCGLEGRNRLEVRPIPARVSSTGTRGLRVTGSPRLII